MASFQYAGPDERTYPDIVIGGRVLVVEPGDVREMDEAPNDGNWVAVKPEKPVKKADA